MRLILFFILLSFSASAQFCAGPVVAAQRWDAQARTFIRSSGAGTTLQTTSIDTLVRDLKGQTNPGYTTGIDLWTPPLAFYPFVGGTATAHAVNLKSPGTYNLTFSGSPTHSSLGVVFAGSPQFANTGILANSLSRGDNHLSLYSQTSTGTGTYDMGATSNFGSGSNQITLALRRASNLALFDDGSGLSERASVSVGDGSGFFIGTATATNARDLYRNGSSIASSTTSDITSTLPAINIYIGAVNSVTSPVGATGYVSRTFSFSSIGPKLTSGQVSTFSTIVNAFETRLGRNTY